MRHCTHPRRRWRRAFATKPKSIHASGGNIRRVHAHIDRSPGALGLMATRQRAFAELSAAKATPEQVHDNDKHTRLAKEYDDSLVNFLARKSAL